MAIKVQILIPCDVCEGEAYVPVEQAKSYSGQPYTRYQPCAKCQGSGKQTKWISLLEFGELLSNVMSRDPMEPDYLELARKQPISQNVDSREAASV
jgi:hypothetical protein